MYFCVVVLVFLLFFFFKQKTAYELRISVWSSDVCSSDLDAAADIFQVEVAGTDRANLYRALRGADRNVARADASDPRRTADVADGGVAGTDRVQVQRTDVAGFQVAGAQRCGQFTAHAGGAHVSRAGVDPDTARAVDAGIAGADLELHGHAVRHAGLQLHVGVVAAEQGEPAELAFALGGDAQPVDR